MTPDIENIDPLAAKNAYQSLLQRARALAPDAYDTGRANLQQAAVIALGVAQRLADPAVRARFAQLPASVFDPRHIDDLPQLALATYHAFVELQRAQAGATEAKLPLALVEDAAQVKARMLALCEYVFADDQPLSLEVADIRSGTGYKDQAVDLARLALLYEEHRAVVSLDSFNYRGTDADDARRLAQAIMEHLSQSQSADARAQRDILTAMWTFLRASYDEVRAAGRFLYRNEHGDAMFPSLFQRTRRPRSEPAAQPQSPAPAETPAATE